MDELAPIIDEATDPTPSADALASLNSRQRAFTLAYIAGSSASRAAEIAGYAQPRAHGSRLLGHPAIRKAIDSVAASAAVSADETVLRLSEIASFDPATIGDRAYKVVDGRRVVAWDVIEELGVGRFIRAVGMHSKQGHEQIQWYSRVEALTALAKVHGLNSDQTNIQVNVGALSVQELRAIVDG